MAIANSYPTETVCNFLGEGEPKEEADLRCDNNEGRGPESILGE